MSEVTFVDEIETIAEEVARSVAATVEGLTNTLAPDGRQFGKRKASEEERIRTYAETLHMNPQGQLDFIRGIVQKILGYLKGAPADVIAQVHPYDIAIKRLIQYSAEMEPKLQEEMMKVRENHGRN